MTDPVDGLASAGTRWEYFIRRAYDVPDLVGPEAAWEHVTHHMIVDADHRSSDTFEQHRDASSVLAATLHHATSSGLDGLLVDRWQHQGDDRPVAVIDGDAQLYGAGERLAAAIIQRLRDRADIGNDLAWDRAVHLIPPPEMRAHLERLRDHWN